MKLVLRGDQELERAKYEPWAFLASGWFLFGYKKGRLLAAWKRSAQIRKRANKVGEDEWEDDDAVDGDSEGDNFQNNRPPRSKFGFSSRKSELCHVGFIFILETLLTAEL